MIAVVLLPVRSALILLSLTSVLRCLVKRCLRSARRLSASVWTAAGIAGIDFAIDRVGGSVDVFLL